MVVVGGRSSANTKELTRLCGIVGTPAVRDRECRRPRRPVAPTGPRGGRDRRHLDADRVIFATSPSASSSWLAPRDRRGPAPTHRSWRSRPSRPPPRLPTARPRSPRTEARCQPARHSVRPMVRDAGLPVVAIVGRVLGPMALRPAASAPRRVLMAVRDAGLPVVAIVGRILGPMALRPAASAPRRVLMAVRDAGLPVVAIVGRILGPMALRPAASAPGGS